MSRKTERAAKRAAKKAAENPNKNKPTTEDLNEEVIPEAVPIDSEEEHIPSDIETASENDSDVEDQENSEIEAEEEEQVPAEVKPKVNDEAAMTRITEEFKLKDLPWIETMTITSKEPIVVEDVDNDMERELAFYKQALEAAKLGKKLVEKANVPFWKPDDYFAEMVKSDEHMAKIDKKLANEKAAIKAAEEAKRQRQLKKFGKKVQIEKQLERQKQKAETLEKIKLLKRKRKNGEDLTVNDDFDIALEKADTKRAKKDKDNKPTKSLKRVMKDKKYGSGGKKGRFAKSNTAESSAELGGYNKMKGKPIFKGKGRKGSRN